MYHFLATFCWSIVELLFVEPIGLTCPCLSFRLCVCNTSGGGLRWCIPDARCDQEKPSQQEVPVSFLALSALCLWAGDAPGAASILCGWPGVHRADGQLRWLLNGDGRRRASPLPVSGICPQPVSLLGRHINMFWTGKWTPLSCGKISRNRKTPQFKCLCVCVFFSLKQSYGVLCFDIVPPKGFGIR